MKRQTTFDFFRPLLIITQLVLSGCADMYLSKKLDEKSNPKDSNHVMVYYLPKALLTIEFEHPQNDNTLSYTFKHTPILVPDTSAGYKLYYQKAFFHSDKSIIQVNDQGLLQSSDGATTSQIPTIFTKLAEVGAKLAEGAKFGVASLGEPKPGTPKNFKRTFDPCEKEADAVKTDLNKWSKEHFDGNLILEVAGCSNVSNDSGNGANSSDGVKYRRPVPVTVAIRDITSQAPLYKFVIVVPDKNNTFTYDIERGVFTETKNTATFTNGMLTKSDITNPSEVGGFFEIPVSLAKLAVSIPASLFQFRVMEEKSGAAELELETKVLEAQKNLFDEQINLMKKQKELEDEIKKLKRD